ncbi:MAG: thiamine-phosphate kinase [Acidimicrobiia bacterium]
MSSEAGFLKIVADIFGDDSRGRDIKGPLRLVEGVTALDDCAVIAIPGGHLVVGSDFIRGAEFYLFQLRILSYRDLGYFLVAANASDVAAMGAELRFVTTNIRFPDDLSDADFVEICLGIREAADEFSGSVVGGDIGGFSRLVLSGTAVGFTASQPLLRRNGLPGDQLFYVGDAGLAGAAVLYFRNKDRLGSLPSSMEMALAESWRRPRPQLEVGKGLAASGWRIAAQDNSDGIKATVSQICAMSGVGAVVDASLFEPHPVVARVADLAGIPPYALALSGSADFGLVFTLPPDASVSELLPDAENVQRLGSIHPQEDGVRFRSAAGVMEARLPGVVWDHQTKPIDEELQLGRGT